ncbi:hypothetical protein K491DRAFT_721300 [Lophiostoma macrostomum CBS 122681]|uniref:Uncharacterized protein n=1 Tax=Lophiostoma macrostomum CBS 122681 TaxID=1314788 RepID=A0A6A6SSA5_9PLEO|nr:hypothetical protein K491DRAFT_721300 [Lophiostoma macrostomum CBS 122681]
MPDWFSQNILTHADELQRRGCLEMTLPNCTLRNEIHPIFREDRWMKGYGQHTDEIYKYMKGALRLASLFLTEDCMLPWFTHILYGANRISALRSAENRKLIYLEVTKKERSRDAIQKTRDSFVALAECVTLMFIPSTYSRTESAYGITNERRKCWEWSKHFRDSDYPYISRKNKDLERDGFKNPEIAILGDFQDYYRFGRRQRTQSECYRMEFMFAVTIVHEVAHAHWMFQRRQEYMGQEPHWNDYEPGRPELGFSWESVTLGRICNFLYHPREYGPLLSTRTYMWPTQDVRKQQEIYQELYQGVPVEQIGFFQAHTPVHPGWLPGHDWRGSEYLCTDPEAAGMSYLCIVHAIPMKWIASWFSEDEWVARRNWWNQTGRDRPGTLFEPPPLGPTFALVYERDMWGQARLGVLTKTFADPYLAQLETHTTGMGFYHPRFYGN